MKKENIANWRLTKYQQVSHMRVGRKCVCVCATQRATSLPSTADNKIDELFRCLFGPADHAKQIEK